MNELMLTILGIVVGILVVMFVAAFIAMTIIKRKHEKKRFNSLPSGGTDSSAYAQMLVQKYKNKRIEGEL